MDKKNAIVCININDYAHDLTLTTLELLAKKTEAAFFNITSSFVNQITNSKFKPAFNKLYIKPITDLYSNTLLIDADTLITPLGLENIKFETDKFFKIKVVDGIPNTLTNHVEVREHCKKELNLFGYDINTFGNYFNSGVMFIPANLGFIVNIAHYLSFLPKAMDLTWCDQTLFNIAIKLAEQNYVNADFTEYLDERYNFIPQGRDVSEAYIIHLAGVEQKDRGALIKKYYKELYG